MNGGFAFRVSPFGDIWTKNNKDDTSPWGDEGTLSTLSNVRRLPPLSPTLVPVPFPVQHSCRPECSSRPRLEATPTTIFDKNSYASPRKEITQFSTVGVDETGAPCIAWSYAVALVPKQAVGDGSELSAMRNGACCQGAEQAVPPSSCLTQSESSDVSGSTGQTLIAM